MPAFAAVSPAQLNRLIGTPDAPLLIDVRVPDDFAEDPRLIPCSVRIAHRDIAAVPVDADRRVVVICHHGAKLSEGAAAILRTRGIRAEALEGGFEGWKTEGLTLTPASALPATRFWVTRQRPKIDRIACPWLIRRFIDPDAQFLFVAPGQVAAVADRFNAVPYDIEDVPFSHRGEHCTFDALLDDFALHTAALDRLATVIRGADTDRHDLAPQAAGLLAISVGLSRMHRDDLAQLEAGITLYDALYRWARDGFEEGHDWPAGRAQ